MMSERSLGWESTRGGAVDAGACGGDRHTWNGGPSPPVSHEVHALRRRGPSHFTALSVTSPLRPPGLGPASGTHQRCSPRQAVSSAWDTVAPDPNMAPAPFQCHHHREACQITSLTERLPEPSSGLALCLISSSALTSI